MSGYIKVQLYPCISWSGYIRVYPGPVISRSGFISWYIQGRLYPDEVSSRITKRYCCQVTKGYCNHRNKKSSSCLFRERDLCNVGYCGCVFEPVCVYLCMSVCVSDPNCVSEYVCMSISLSVYFMSGCLCV